ncbi:unnamed protein product [Heligmosomoides polygyrus]|uniref:G protein-coupled receptor n=1 Tax=Heligmosomoides polygyrus TaxID=6339 RepID=A0A183F3U8_HELPZ|nr:unnamed protein product [Heligmosomoides polygyrus]
MHVFYFNLPWIIDGEDYNCSSRPPSEWTSRGSVNIVQGVYFMTAGAFFVVLYSLCLLGMFRGHLLNYPCYRLMFFNGIVAIADLCVNSLIASYFHLEVSYYTVLLVPIHNITVLVLITLLYSVLCAYVFQFGKMASGGIDKVQVQLFVQALLICTTTAMTASLYVYLALFDVPPVIFIATNVVWQLNHGLHGIVYIIFNQHIRREVIGMRGLAMKYVLNSIATIRCGRTEGSRNAWT